MGVGNRLLKGQLCLLQDAFVEAPNENEAQWMSSSHQRGEGIPGREGELIV